MFAQHIMERLKDIFFIYSNLLIPTQSFSESLILLIPELNEEDIPMI
jgi:hypothetical protein